MYVAKAGYKVDWTIAAAAAVGLVGVALSNALFAYKLGAYPVEMFGRSVLVDGLVLGALSTVLSVFQARAATTIIRGSRGEPKLTAALIFVVCFAYSSAAMASHVIELQRKQDDFRADKSQGFTLAANALEDAKAALEAKRKAKAALDAEKARTASARTQAEIRADMETLRGKYPKTWRNSSHCSEAWALDNEPCVSLRPLNVELAAAIEAEDLAPKLAKAALDVDAALAKVDAARAKLAAESKPKETDDLEKMLRFWIVVTFAIALECVETFGFALAYRRDETAPDPEPEPDACSPPTGGAKGKATAEDVLRLIQQARDGAVRLSGARVSGGRVTVGQKSLADALGISKATVNARVQRLVNEGRLIAAPGAGGTTFEIVYHRISAVAP